MKGSNRQQKSMRRYLPLFVLIGIAFVGSTAVTYGIPEGKLIWMHYFMGFFFCLFAMLKLFNPVSFADGFQMYDVLAKKFRGYAYLYPYIELGLGLAYLSFIYSIFTYTLTVALMGISAIGVIKALRKGLDVRCACMGTVLDVPLSTVTLSEDLMMGGMAIVMLLSL